MSKRLLLTVLFLLGSVSPLWSQQFYQWKDGRGLWNFSNNRPAGIAPDQVKVKFYPPSSFSSGDPYNRGYQDGFSQGYEKGFKEFYERRYEEGRKEGFKEGYHAWSSEQTTEAPNSGQ